MAVKARGGFVITRVKWKSKHNGTSFKHKKAHLKVPKLPNQCRSHRGRHRKF